MTEAVKSAHQQYCNKLRNKENKMNRNTNNLMENRRMGREEQNSN